MAALMAVAFRLIDRQTRDAQRMQGVLDAVQFERLDDSNDKLHDFSVAVFHHSRRRTDRRLAPEDIRRGHMRCLSRRRIASHIAVASYNCETDSEAVSFGRRSPRTFLTTARLNQPAPGKTTRE